MSGYSEQEQSAARLWLKYNAAMPVVADDMDQGPKLERQHLTASLAKLKGEAGCKAPSALASEAQLRQRL